MKALRLQLKTRPWRSLEAIVLIECCEGKEDPNKKMAEMHDEIFDKLIKYNGKQKQRDVKTVVYDTTAFYLRTLGLHDYIWVILRTVMERPEFRFSKPYSDYIRKGVGWGFLPQSILAQYNADLETYLNLESIKNKAASRYYFNLAIKQRDEQKKMREKVYVTD